MHFEFAPHQHQHEHREEAGGFFEYVKGKMTVLGASTGDRDAMISIYSLAVARWRPELLDLVDDSGSFASNLIQQAH